MFKFTNLVILEITRGCNLDCSYCLMTHKKKYKGEVIDFEVFKKIINKIVEHRKLQRLTKETLSLVFHGGEPFMVGNKNFYKMADYAYNTFNENDIKFSLGTQSNLTYMNDEFAKMLKKYSFSIGVSIDDLGPGNDYRMKNSKEFFEDKLKILDKNGIKYGFISVITDKNIDTFTNFRRKVLEKGGILTNLLMVDNPDDVDYRAKDEDIIRIHTEMIEDFCNGKKIATKTTNLIYMAIQSVVAHHKKVYKSGCNGKICGTAIGMISVRPDGWFGNCDRITSDSAMNDLMHIDTYDFLSIKQLKRAIFLAEEKIKVIKQKGCDHCRADYVCTHGCLLFNYAKEEKFSVRDDECVLYRFIYDYFNNNIVDIINKIIDNNVKISYLEEIYDFKDEIVDKLNTNNIFVKIDKENKNLIFGRIK